MTWIKTWIKPVVLVIVWITVLSYTVSMVATVEPTLRRLGQMTEHAIDYVALPSEMRSRLLPPNQPPRGTVTEFLLSAGTVSPREEYRWTLVPTEGVRPRAFVAPRWRWAPASETLDAVFSSGHETDPGLVVLTGSGPPAPADRDSQPLSPCQIVSYLPDRVELDCGSAAGGYAVLADENAPGWAAMVDGKPEQVVPADVLFRAVPVPAGRHRIELRYQTPLLRAGAIISLASWADLVLLFWRRRFAGARRDSVEAPADAVAPRPQFSSQVAPRTRPSASGIHRSRR